jgi:hypothetical protein
VQFHTDLPERVDRRCGLAIAVAVIYWSVCVRRLLPFYTMLCQSSACVGNLKEEHYLHSPPLDSSRRPKWSSRRRQRVVST